MSRRKGLIFSPQIFDRCAEDIPGIFSFSLLLSASLSLKKERKSKGKGKNQNFQKLRLSMLLFAKPLFGKEKLTTSSTIKIFLQALNKRITLSLSLYWRYVKFEESKKRDKENISSTG